MCGVVGYEPMAGDVAAHGGVGDSPHRGQPAAEQGGQRACEGPEARQPSTMHAMAALASGLCRHTSTKCERQRLGQSLHDTFGTTDALYGTLADTIPTLTTAGGVPCGLAVWLLADARALPALRLSQPPTRQEAGTPLSALVAYRVSGLTTEAHGALSRRSGRAKAASCTPQSQAERRGL
jgi:hypothetical protein